MGKKHSRKKTNSYAIRARKKAKARREALWSYLVIAILAGIVIVGLYIQFLHHP
jgi:hypothetical protein